MDKPALINKIKSLDGLSNDEKADLIHLLNETKQYGLVWEDKPEAVEEQLRTQLPVLIEVPERRILADALNHNANEIATKKNTTPDIPDLFTTTSQEPMANSQEPLANSQQPKANSQQPTASPPNHILIEGDNLHALTALTFTHEGKIDVMYFDPPYNTGNKDFKYNDSFVDKEDSYRHSKWLSFMEKRLRIAKQLLSEKGVIFISIDDNEQAQLKMLSDAIFGEQNFIGEIVWFKKRKGSFLSNQLISLTEYILPYRKGEPIQLFGGTPDNTESQPIVKRTNSRKNLFFKKNIVNTKLKNGLYKKGTYGDGSIASVLHNDIEVENGVIITDFTLEAPFVWSQEFLNKEIEFGTEILINTTNFQVRVIRHNNISIKAMPSFLDGREFGATNEDAYEFLKSMFHTDRAFDYSKPVNLIKKIIESSTYFKKSSIILDIFAGSGTTLHATMQLNAEDGGNRQCILVTNNENNIAEEICYERNKRVIQGYTNSKGNWVSGLTNNNLRYYKTDFVGSARTEQNRRKLTRLSTALLQIKEDCYTDITVQNGFDPELCHISTNECNRHLIVLYHSRKQTEVVELLRAFIRTLSETDEKIKLYAFGEEKEILLDAFYDVAERLEAVPLPDSIYNAYRATFRSLKLERKAPVTIKTEVESGLETTDDETNPMEE